jgi:hypothetical protein
LQFDAWDLKLFARLKKRPHPAKETAKKQFSDVSDKQQIKSGSAFTCGL